jgi:tetratricopeptide (TPR) repeat protein
MKRIKILLLPLLLCCGCATTQFMQLNADMLNNSNNQIPKETLTHALFNAVSSDDIVFARALLDHGADVEWWSPLTVAVGKGYADIAKLLLERGANPLAKNSVGDTALMIAKRNNNTAMIDLLNAYDPGYVQLLSEEKNGDDAAQSGKAKKALDIYAKLLRNPAIPDEDRARIQEKLVGLVPKLDAVPEIPEEAHKHMVKGMVLFKDAGVGNIKKAVDEMQQVIAIAPWWTEAYFNLAKMEEGVGQYDAAIRDLKLYLLGNPQADDARAVQDHIYALEAKRDEGKSQTDAPAEPQEPAQTRKRTW